MDSLRWTALRWSYGRLGDVAMDGLGLTGCNGWLVMDGWAMERWTARNGRLGDGAMDGLAMERWSAGDGRLGNGKMNGLQWMAHNGRLGDGAMDS